MTLSAEQQAMRSTRLTGSSIAGLLGRSPWDSPLEAWEHQTGRREFAGNDDTDAGNFMEGGIGGLSLHKLGIDPSSTERPGTLLHPDWPDIFAVTPDLVIPGEKLGVQIKNHLPWAARRYHGQPQTAGRWDNRLVPEEKLMQCLLELEVVGRLYGGPKGWDVWFLASYFGGSHLRLYWLHRDSRIISAMLQAGRRFWKRHLDPAGRREAPSPECTCGGCGRGEKWWIDNERPEPAPVKLTAEEILAAPAPFPDERPLAPIEAKNLF